MKTLFILASVMVVLFLAAPNKVEAQKRAAAKTLVGTISGYECGDNCYLTITDKNGKEHVGLCTSRPLCTAWNAETEMPDSYKGRRVKVTVGKGKRFDGSGHVVDAFVAFTKIQLLPQSLTVEMKEQLAAEMVKNAYNPEYFEPCMDEAGGMDKIVDIKAITLSNSGGQQYLLTGKADTATCAFGASKPMHWIYEYREGEFRMLADIGACSGVKVTSRRTNGYLDLQILVVFNAGRSFSYATYKYDGTTYECSNCGRD
ncbi:MAG: hypothetical protein ACKVRN_10075 [Pyrinomonadaceae bacterium]